MKIGQTVGALKIIKESDYKRATPVSKYPSKHYICECQCGNLVEVPEGYLEYRIVKSCGCRYL
ncbi:MAG TPA: hypothetical protein VIK63_02920 [Haloplasmataceae bacterium]